jgi:hypothetical protein
MLNIEAWPCLVLVQALMHPVKQMTRAVELDTVDRFALICCATPYG